MPMKLLFSSGEPVIQKSPPIMQGSHLMKLSQTFVADRSGEVNRANWDAAMQEQGFTPNAQDLPTLNSQRIWYDKNAPGFGQGQ